MSIEKISTGDFVRVTGEGRRTFKVLYCGELTVLVQQDDPLAELQYPVWSVYKVDEALDKLQSVVDGALQSKMDKKDVAQFLYSRGVRVVDETESTPPARSDKQVCEAVESAFATIAVRAGRSIPVKFEVTVKSWLDGEREYASMMRLAILLVTDLLDEDAEEAIRTEYSYLGIVTDDML